MPQADVILSAQFLGRLCEVESDAIVDKVDKSLHLLKTFPEMGSLIKRPALEDRYGVDARKLVIGPYLVIYAFVGDEVHVLDLVPGYAVR